MVAIDKSASDKANPTGELRARKLIRWYNEGAGGKIRWGTPGDFDACVRIAGKHMTPDQAKGFCSNRHKDATGARPGKAPAERATRTRKASLLRRYLELRKAARGKFEEAKHPRADDGKFGHGAGKGVAHAKWLKGLEGRYPSVKLDIVEHGDGHISVDRIVVPKEARNQGLGTKVMHEVLARADDEGRVVSLSPSTDFGGTKSGLERWYKGLGFRPNTGRSRNLEISDSWIRDPQSPTKKHRATKAIDGQRTYDETRELVNRAIRLAIGGDDNGYCYVRDLTDEWAVFEVSTKGGTSALYQVRYQLGLDGSVALGEPFPVEQHTDFDPATKALTSGGASPMSTSAMVALYPPKDVAEALALGGGYDPEDLHITLAFLGSDAVLRTSRDSVTAVLGPLAGALSPLEGSVSGIGRFTPEIPPGTGEAEWPLVALIDIPALPEFRQQLVAALGAAGVEVATNHGFCPHMTLAMVGPDDEWAAGQILAAGVEATPLRFGEVVLSWGDERIAFPLGGRSPDADAAAAPAMKAVAGPLVKEDGAKRYTLMPLYPASPERPTAGNLDAHGDMATADDLQAAVWDHVRKGDRTIRDQHRGGTAIGEWVELLSWPYDVTVPMTKADGSVEEKDFAAGTVFMGVVWTPAAFDDVRKGRKTGLSLGGAATRVDVEMA